MKALAIFTVIGIHGSWGGWSDGGISEIAAIENLWQFLLPVPLFMIIMGFNYGNSFKRKNYQTLKEMYSGNYFKSMFSRIIVPIIFAQIICVIYAAYGWMWAEIRPHPLFIFNVPVAGWDTTWTNADPFGAMRWVYNDAGLIFVGVLIFTGPGTYFLTICIWFIFVFPLFYYLFLKKGPIKALIICYIFEFLLQITIKQFDLFNGTRDSIVFYGDNRNYIFDSLIFRYTTAIGLGLWFCFTSHEIMDKRHLFIVMLALPSLALLVHFFTLDVQGFDVVCENYIFRDLFKIEPYWGKTNLFTYFWPAFIFLVGMKILPEEIDKNRDSKFILKFQLIVRKISQLTFHILLIQIIYFYPGGWWSLHGIFLENIYVPNIGTFWAIPSKIIVICIGFIICTIIAYFFEKITTGFANHKLGPQRTRKIDSVDGSIMTKIAAQKKQE